MPQQMFAHATTDKNPDNKVYGANMGPTSVLSAQDGLSGK